MKKIAIGLAGALLSTSVAVAAPSQRDLVRVPPPLDEQVECPDSGLTPRPEAILPPPRSGAATVNLDVLALVDPSHLSQAQEALAGAATAYERLGIRLRTSFRAVPVPDLDGDDKAYMEWTKQQVGGKPPPGFDVVYLALHHPIQIGGRADCVGGITRDETSFAIGMLTMSGLVGVSIEGYPLPQGPPIAEGGAKVAAHEIGHLLGAHHHYGQCGAGFETSDPAHPCDVMFSGPKRQMGLFFGPVTGSVIRYFARQYARP